LAIRCGSGGFLVDPEEVEGFLQQQPGVAAAQVVAAERGGDRVAVAFVCAEPGRRPDESAILAACRENLAPRLQARPRGNSHGWLRGSAT
jgi:acyl-CoA synthetase (AMP-forming)/AMP-acid ligase II